VLCQIPLLVPVRRCAVCDFSVLCMEKTKANSSYPVRYMMYLGFDKCAAAENTGMIRSSRAAHSCRTASISPVEIWKPKAYVWSSYRSIQCRVGERWLHLCGAVTPSRLVSIGKLQGEMFATSSDCLSPHSFDLDITYTVSYI
jgi:hypothetical protein